MGILGPTQPYLAKQVGVPNHQISFIWTGRALGDCMAAVITSVIFRRFICKSWQKLAFLAVCLLLSGGFGLLVPLITSFPLLLPALLGAGFFIGSYNTANNSLVVYMLGPDKCPPYIQSLHAFTSAGFVLSSLVVRPFFPEVNVDAICGFSDVQEEASTEREVVNLSWPYLLISAAHILPAVGFFLIVACRLVMPLFYEEAKEEELKEEKRKEVKYPNLILLLALFFFSLSCGIESIFQSQSFTFGLCGPHKLTPQQAASLTTTLCVSFLAGRFSGIFLSTKFSPSVMVVATNLGCLISSVLLATTAGWVVESLYLGTAIMGFSISMQVASGFAWLADQVDMTGFRNSVVFLGGNSGWLTFPPLAGIIIFSGPGGVGVYLLSLGICLAQLLLVGLMLKLATLKE